MAASHGDTVKVPLVHDSAPRVHLVSQNNGTDSTSIACRRVVTLLGSRDGCKVHLRHRSVSAVHVAIVNTGTSVIAVDLVTARPPMLNSLKMEHERLTDGDVLALPPFVFRIAIEQPDENGNADAHPFLDPTPHVIALEHVSTQRLLQSNRDVCIIGRRNGCDIVLSDNQVSRAHCLLFSYFGYPVVFDLLSRNQTLVNGTPTVYQALKNGDILTIGDTRFRVHLVESKVGTNNKPKGRDNGRPPIVLPPVAVERDMIDIEATESSQRWTVADNIKKASRKK